jgi:pimeloyl-ACP methyl ester carboxylesterase
MPTDAVPDAPTGRGGAPAFLAAYDTILGRWPRGTGTTDVPTAPFGVTHLHHCGPGDGAPVVLLPGGGTSSVVWWDVAADLAAAGHRVYAPDLIGEPGRSAADPHGRPIRTRGDLVAWLGALLDGLGLESTALYGHSYGSWIALMYALAVPARVRHLVLLDPTGCFTGFAKGYLLRALPMLLHPTPRSRRTFLAWEARGGPRPDAETRRLLEAAAAFPTSRPVVTRPPDAAVLRARAGLPTLVLLAGRSRAHHVDRVADAARGALPGVRIETLSGVGHHALPAVRPPGTDALVTTFLTV